MKVEHIGIAVKDLKTSNVLFEKLLKTKNYKTEKVESEKVNTSFFKSGETKIELLESTDASSAIGKFIEKRGEGIHHIAFEVENIFEEMKRMKADGFQLLSEVPMPGVDNKMVCFLHPKSANGVLIELVQERKNP